MDILKNFKDELFNALIYRELSNAERDAGIKRALALLSAMEESHASIFERMAERRGVKLKGLSRFDRLRAKTFVLFRRFVGLGTTIKLLKSREEASAEKYRVLTSSSEIEPQEREMLKQVITDEIVHKGFLANQDVSVSKVRNAIYGVSDGLVEVLAAVSGFNSVLGSSFLVGLSGFVVGISGMLSMTLGSYLSSKSEREIKESKRREMKGMLSEPAITEGLRRLLEEGGVGREKALELASRMVKDEIVKRETEPEMLSEEESAKVTAISYITGALIPTIPYFLGLSGIFGLLASYILTGIAMGIAGYLVGTVSGVNPKRRAIETASLGLLAAIGTYSLGLLSSHYLKVSV